MARPFRLYSAGAARAANRASRIRTAVAPSRGSAAWPGCVWKKLDPAPKTRQTGRAAANGHACGISAPACTDGLRKHAYTPQKRLRGEMKRKDLRIVIEELPARAERRSEFAYSAVVGGCNGKGQPCTKNGGECCPNFTCVDNWPFTTDRWCDWDKNEMTVPW